MTRSIARGETEPIAVGLVSPAREPTEAFEARETRFIAGLYPTKERLKGKVKPLERNLRRLCIQPGIHIVGSAQFGEISALLGEPNAGARPLPRRDPLLKCCVVKSLMHPEHIQERRVLRRRWIHAIYDLATVHVLANYTSSDARWKGRPAGRRGTSPPANGGRRRMAGALPLYGRFDGHPAVSGDVLEGV